MTPGPHKELLTALVLEEHPMMRDALVSGCSRAAEAGLRVTVEPFMGYPALAERVDATAPDVLVVGANRFSDGALEALAELLRTHPHLGLVQLYGVSVLSAAEQVRRLVEQAGRGVALLPRHAVGTYDELIQVITQVHEGRMIVDNDVAGALLAEPEEEGLALARLTAREREIVHLLAEGYRNAVIARMLVLEPRTVERHVNNINRKLLRDDGQVHPRVWLARRYAAVAEVAVAATSGVPA
jgi:DNA-binding NarL/FixJ family response regulator